MTSGVVGGDELFDGDHDVVMIFRLGSEDGQEAGAVVNSDDGLCIAANGRGGEELEVEEDALANGGGRGRETGIVEVSIVQLSDSAGGAGAKEAGHEVDILTDEMGVMREVTLV